MELKIENLEALENKLDLLKHLVETSRACIVLSDHIPKDDFVQLLYHAINEIDDMVNNVEMTAAVVLMTQDKENN